MIQILKDQKIICNAGLADTFFTRLIGLMFKSSLAEDEGLLIKFRYFGSEPIHGFFMRFPIDLIFLDADGVVVETALLKPWRVFKPKKKSAYVLEVREGFIEKNGLKISDTLSFKKYS
jgi:uncharacterized membrane protein (UPF0127 family)